MGKKDRRVDAYIAKSPGFAQPVLEYLREMVHTGCPDVEETIKWNIPFFDYKGLLCTMAAFKAHCVFGFWKPALVMEETPTSADAAGQFGRITSIDDLPPRNELLRLVRKAARLNDAGVKPPPRKAVRTAPSAEVPAELSAALAKNKKADAAFRGLPPSHRREYIDWISGAKTEATRERRLRQALEWIAEGKSRNWKYEKKK